MVRPLPSAIRSRLVRFLPFSARLYIKIECLTCGRFIADCPADSAVGKNSINCDFTKGKCDAFENLSGHDLDYDGSKGLVCSLDSVTSIALQTKQYIFFGRVEMEMQANPGAGIISTLVLLSDDLDEIDFEVVGNDGSKVQTNIFGKGDQSDHSHGGFQDVNDAFGRSHTYAIDWTPDKIEWFVDGKSERTLSRAEAGDKYPQSPMQVKIGPWVAGYKGGNQDTAHWAGGNADFSNGPSLGYYKSIKVTDYAGGSSATDKDVKEYKFGDHSGSSGSIQIKLQDGSTTSGGEPSKDHSSSSSSETSSKTESHSSSKTSTSTTESKTESKTASKTQSSATTPTSTGTSSSDDSSTNSESKTGTSTTPTPTPNGKSNGAAANGVAMICVALAAAFAI